MSFICPFMLPALLFVPLCGWYYHWLWRIRQRQAPNLGTLGVAYAASG